MKILKPFTNWLNRIGAENNKKINDFDYNYSYDFMERVRERQRKENERFDSAKKAANTVLNQKTNNYTLGNLSAYAITSSNISTSTISNKSGIYIDSANDRVSINFPLEVNGRDILKELDEMRDALLLLKREVDMEAKYPKLKEIKDEYERELAKYKTFERLK